MNPSGVFLCMKHEISLMLKQGAGVIESGDARLREIEHRRERRHPLLGAGRPRPQRASRLCENCLLSSAPVN